MFFCPINGRLFCFWMLTYLCDLCSFHNHNIAIRRSYVFLCLLKFVFWVLKKMIFNRLCLWCAIIMLYCLKFVRFLDKPDIHYSDKYCFFIVLLIWIFIIKLCLLVFQSKCFPVVWVFLRILDRLILKLDLYDGL